MTAHARPGRPIVAPELTPRLGKRERDYVFAVAMKFVKDPIAAEDVTQDALLLAHLHRDDFRGDSRFSTWLYRVAATTALMYLRKKKRRAREILASATTSSDGQGPGLLDRSDNRSGADERLAACERLALIDLRLEAMGPRYRRVFWMRFADGLTEPEVADRMDLHLSTVKTRTHRARKAIASDLAAEMALAA